MREILGANRRVVAPHANTRTGFWFRLDAVRVNDAPTAPNEIEQSLEPATASEGDHRVHSIGSRCP